MNILDKDKGPVESLPEEIIKKIMENVSSRRVAKGTILQRKGDTVLKAYMVKSGLLRSYAIDEDGKEHIFMFGPEGWLVLDVELFVIDAQSALFIDALEDSELEVYNVAIFEQVAQYPASVLAKEVVKLTNRVLALQRRIILLLSATASERYRHFLDTYPAITQRVSQRMIASYLGMTPEALSRARKEFSKT